MNQRPFKNSKCRRSSPFMPKGKIKILLLLHIAQRKTPEKSANKPYSTSFSSYIYLPSLSSQNSFLCLIVSLQIYWFFWRLTISWNSKLPFWVIFHFGFSCELLSFNKNVFPLLICLSVRVPIENLRWVGFPFIMKVDLMGVFPLNF